MFSWRSYASTRSKPEVREINTKGTWIWFCKAERLHGGRCFEKIIRVEDVA
ncbi:hypothetical protein F2Q68_00021943 [Brassica cretica]|uniref:Uncharacterized protein n=2 Tax=Brassica cretica TaxID=69181 RepID=A0A8S9FTI1_BRACR|nr:hypothetical protein F2Q68_00021943 [Brassica cretica]KAF3569242.1 hypothetical protein DY000_02017586 [Brassica cretica]